jgi:hypothetical protein
VKSKASPGFAERARRLRPDTNALKAIVMMNWRLDILIIVIPPDVETAHRPDVTSLVPDASSRTSTNIAGSTERLLAMWFNPDATMFGMTGEARPGRGSQPARQACVSLDASRHQRYKAS